MKYKKAEVEIVRFQETEFMAGSGNLDGGSCNHYTGRDGTYCGYVTLEARGLFVDWYSCSEYGGEGTPFVCGNVFPCGNF